MEEYKNGGKYVDRNAIKLNSLLVVVLFLMTCRNINICVYSNKLRSNQLNGKGLIDKNVLHMQK